MHDLPTGTVTFLFTDVEGSTRLLHELGERYADVLAEHRRILRDALARHGGVEVDTQGDALFAAFARASDAVAAAASAQEALTRLGVRVRMGLHTGEPLLTDDGYVGIDVHRAARIAAVAHGGQVLLSQATHDLVDTDLRDLGEHRLKDLLRPERLYQVGGGEFPPLNTLENRPTNLPTQATPFIGRDRELRELCALLRREDVRLLTLTGPGGTGKTRLALQAAAELVEEVPNGVFFVSLAPLTDSALVTSTIAQTLGLRESAGSTIAETLKEYLRDKLMLLLLDNFEQLLPAAPLVAELLAEAPGTKTLVTSRAPLHLAGEREYAVPPLPTPDPGVRVTVESLSRYDAVALFIDRAQAIRPDFRLTNAGAPALADICHRLDGLPLAIELAASRVRLLSLEEMRERLVHRLQLLGGGARDLPARQQTLRATIDWSHELLHETGRALLARLGVFVGGCTLEAAEAVCGDEVDVLEGLASLVDQSLLRRKEGADGVSRYLMLEIVREYALEHLAARGEVDSLRRRHFEHYLALAEQAEPQILRGDQVLWLGRLEPERHNCRAALGWAAEHREAELGLRLIGALRRAWVARGYLSETRSWLEAALALADGVMVATRARALYGLGRVALVQGDYAEARARLEQSAALYRDLNDAEGVVFSLADLGWIATVQGDQVRARALAEESLAHAREAADEVTIAAALHSLACTHLDDDDYGPARELFEESLALRRRLGDKRNTANSLLYLGVTALLEGDDEGATALLDESLALGRELQNLLVVAAALANLALVALFESEPERAGSLAAESLRLARDVGDKRTVVECLHALAGIAAALGDAERATMLTGSAEALHAAIDAPPSPAERVLGERFLSSARSELGEDRFAAALAAGRALPPDGAVEFALGETSKPPRH